MKTTRPIIAALALTGSALLTGCGVGEASVSDEASVQAATPVPVEVAQAYRTNIYATYEATATISSDADAPVVARVAGEIVELLVEEGDRVVKGQVLARLDGERSRLEMLAAKANLKQARTEYERNVDLHARGLISASMFDSLQFELAALEATYELRKLTYDYSKIRAPIAGIVVAREVKPGQHLDINDVAFRITETSELIAYQQTPQSELSKFSAGDTASIQVASMPGSEFPATIARVSPTIDARNGTFRATAIIDNKNGDLAPGMFGRFTIAYEQHTDALVIPAVAILDEDDLNTVYVVSDGEVIRRAVDVGILTDGNVEILGGLSDDETVVVVGQSGLRNGSKVLASTSLLHSFTG